jgi:hypothetical protein
MIDDLERRVTAGQRRFSQVVAGVGSEPTKLA